MRSDEELNKELGRIADEHNEQADRVARERRVKAWAIRMGAFAFELGIQSLSSALVGSALDTFSDDETAARAVATAFLETIPGLLPGG